MHDTNPAESPSVRDAAGRFLRLLAAATAAAGLAWFTVEHFREISRQIRAIEQPRDELGEARAGRQ